MYMQSASVVFTSSNHILCLGLCTKRGRVQGDLHDTHICTQLKASIALALLSYAMLCGHSAADIRDSILLQHEVVLPGPARDPNCVTCGCARTILQTV